MVKMYSLCVTLVTLLSIQSTHGAWKSAEQRLTEDIRARLHWEDMNLAIPVVIPIYDLSKGLNVTVVFQLRKILEFSEKKELLTTMYQKTYTWQNYQMTWKPELYDGLKRMRYPKSEIWTPDIILLQTTYSYVPSERGAEYVTIQYDGTITMMEPVIYAVHCTVKMTDFPYDNHRCEMRWGSWSFLNSELNMISPSNRMDLSQFLPHQEWVLYDDVVAEELAEYWEPDLTVYEDMVYTFRLRRKPAFYFKLILLPTFLLSTLMFTVFWIPPTRPDRTTVAMSIYSGFMLFLLLVVSIAPPSTGIKLGLYYSICICMVVVSIVFSGAVVALSSKEVHMDPAARRVLVEIIGSQMGYFRQYTYMMRYGLIDNFSNGTTSLLNADDKKTMDPHAEMNLDDLDPANRKRMENRRDWQVASLVIDRILFVFFALTSSACLIWYFPWPPPGTDAT